MFSQACHDEKPAYIKSKGNSRPTSGNSLQVRWESRRRFNLQTLLAGVAGKISSANVGLRPLPS